jgi:CBS domain-containing protein
MRPASNSHAEEAEMKCSEVMTGNPICCLPTDTADKVAQLMKKDNIGPVPVIENHQNKRLVGIVTDRDLAIKVVATGRDARSTPVEGIMSRHLVSCSMDDDLQKAIAAMAERQLRRIPVVDHHNRIVGIIAQADVATRVNQPETTAQMVKEISKSNWAN